MVENGYKEALRALEAEVGRQYDEETLPQASALMQACCVRASERHAAWKVAGSAGWLVAGAAAARRWRCDRLDNAVEGRTPLVCRYPPLPHPTCDAYNAAAGRLPPARHPRRPIACMHPWMILPFGTSGS